jgi:hypothetical protein
MGEDKIIYHEVATSHPPKERGTRVRGTGVLGHEDTKRRGGTPLKENEEGS